MFAFYAGGQKPADWGLVRAKIMKNNLFCRQNPCYGLTITGGHGPGLAVWRWGEPEVTSETQQLITLSPVSRPGLSWITDDLGPGIGSIWLLPGGLSCQDRMGTRENYFKFHIVKIRELLIISAVADWLANLNLTNYFGNYSWCFITGGLGSISWVSKCWQVCTNFWILF